MASGSDALEQSAHLRLAGDDDFFGNQRFTENVESEVSLALVAIKTVTGKAVVRQNRPDVAIEADDIIGSAHRGQPKAKRKW